MKEYLIAYCFTLLPAGLYNAFRCESEEITFNEAFARTVVWPLCVFVAFVKGLWSTVKGGFA